MYWTCLKPTIKALKWRQLNFYVNFQQDLFSSEILVDFERAVYLGINSNNA